MTTPSPIAATAGRIKAMLKALQSGADLDATMRSEIAAAIAQLLPAPNALRARPKSRPIAHGPWFAAAIAKELLEHHGAKTAYDADRAAAKSLKWQEGLDPESDTPAYVMNISRKRQQLTQSGSGFIQTKSGGKFQVVLISPTWTDYAVERLNGGSGATLSSGDAVGVMVELYDPIDEEAS